jgi:hypothetical protein
MLPLQHLPPHLRPDVARPAGPAASPAAGGSLAAQAAQLPNLAQLGNATLHARPNAPGLTAGRIESAVLDALVQPSAEETA